MVIRGSSPSPSARQLVKALRERDPEGMARVYEHYAEDLYDYSWWLLRDRGTAWEALHDALLAASVHAKALRSPSKLRPWLYALVRAECLRCPPSLPGVRERDEATGEVLNRATLNGAEPHALAWKAIESVPVVDADALVLHVRHRMELADLALVLGGSVGETRHLLERARTRVGQTLRTEILARTSPGDCAEVAAALRALADHPTAQGYAHVDRHARSCSTCAPRVPRRVSFSRLIEALPTARPPDDLRTQVSKAYADPRLEDYRSLAARRLQPLGRGGFPRSARHQPRRRSVPTVAAATVSGLLASAVCVALAVLGYAAVTGGTHAPETGGRGAGPGEEAEARIGAATPSPTEGLPPVRPTPAARGPR